jgi:MFS family permease
MRVRGPLADSYPAAVALVVCALIPFLCLTAAVFELIPQIEASLHLSPSVLNVTIALSDAGYAVGTVLAVQFATHFPQRRMLLGYVSLFVVSAFLAAWAPDRGVFIGAFITEGLCTSLLLIGAVPPLVTGWPVPKLPWTGAVMNLCIFGAVAIGPTIGGVVAASGDWHSLLWGVFGVAVLALVFAVLTFEDAPPQDTTAPFDVVAVSLAVLGCGAAFYGAGDLEAATSARVQSLAPLVIGAGLIVALVAYEYRIRRPLMPVRQLVTVFPVVGIITALSASAASFGLMELSLTALDKTTSSTHVAIEFLPEFGAAVIMAALFGVLFRTRFTPVLALGGLVVICAAAAVVAEVPTGGPALAAVGSALIGLGVGASVSPALFIAGFSLRSSQIQRVFALIELMRAVTAFLVAPVLVFIASSIGPTAADGIAWTSYLCLAIAGIGGLAALAVFRFGGGHLQTPDLEAWQKEEPAWDSPPLFGPAPEGADAPSPSRERREVA